MLLEARDEALALLRAHGSLDAPELGPLLDAARRRFGDERAPIGVPGVSVRRRRGSRGRRLAGPTPAT